MSLLEGQKGQCGGHTEGEWKGQRRQEMRQTYVSCVTEQKTNEAADVIQ